MINYIEEKPNIDTLWRAIILFGRNVASFKFALGKTLLELAVKEKTFVKLDELAEPFSRHICEHLKLTDKQGTSSRSRFLDACRQFNEDKISDNDLHSKTTELGFNNVIDAFHNVNNAPISIKFFIDERKTKKGILITDELFTLKERLQFTNLPYEVEARWRLVETAWSLDISPKLLVINYDENNEIFFANAERIKRVNITSSRDSLNGYQKGKCFFCFRDIKIDRSDSNMLADVDHFFPHMLTRAIHGLNFNGVWNLVLACRECNRGTSGKSAKIPERHLLERLYRRNEYLISSHHPLRETIMNQTGLTTEARMDFMKKIDAESINYLVHRWKPGNEYGSTF
jgi:hypothetical protein